MLSPSPISFDGPFAYAPSRGEAFTGFPSGKLAARPQPVGLLDASTVQTVRIGVESAGTVRLDRIAQQLALMAGASLEGARFTQLVPEDAEHIALADECVNDDMAVLGLVRLFADHGDARLEMIAIDRGPWVDLPAILGLLNTLLRMANSTLRYAVLRGETSEARVLCEDERAIRMSVELGCIELENPDDALSRSYDEEEPS